MPTQEELIEAGRKAFAAKDREKKRTKAVAEATKKLIAAHRPEYDGYLGKK